MVIIIASALSTPWIDTPVEENGEKNFLGQDELQMIKWPINRSG